MDETSAGGRNPPYAIITWTFLSNFLFEHVQYIRLYLDSTSYFKCKYLIYCAAENIYAGLLKQVIITHIVSGHAKVEPNSLFLTMSKRTYTPDVFNTAELWDIVRKCAE